MREFAKRHEVAVAVGAYLAFLLVAGLVPGGMEAGPVGYVAFCAATGVAEEAVFCGVMYGCLRTGQRDLRAACVVAVLFGLAHLSLATGMGMALMKVVQAAAFSLCMMGLYSHTGHIAVPMAAHAVFDGVYFAAPWMETGLLPPYPATVSPDANLVVLAGTTLFLAVAATIIFRPNTTKDT